MRNLLLVPKSKTYCLTTRTCPPFFATRHGIDKPRNTVPTWAPRARMLTKSCDTGGYFRDTEFQDPDQVCGLARGLETRLPRRNRRQLRHFPPTSQPHAPMSDIMFSGLRDVAGDIPDRPPSAIKDGVASSALHAPACRCRRPTGGVISISYAVIHTTWYCLVCGRVCGRGERTALSGSCPGKCWRHANFEG